jgi:FKBP12-rapamycin complex-associated protein
VRRRILYGCSMVFYVWALQIAPRRGRPSLQAVACIGSLAEAIGPKMEEHVRGVIDSMFLAGLSPTLVTALEKISSNLPVLLPTVQEKLLDSISFVLAKAPYRTTRGGLALVRPATSPITVPVVECTGPALTQLALHTLTTFNLQGHELLEFAREVVATYLEDEDAVTRREAAVCCCHLVEHSSCVVLSATTTPHLVNTRSGRTTGVGSRRRRVLIEEILEKLLVAAVADSDVGVRKAVFVSLQQNRSFEEFLAQADSLRGIFIALSDEVGDDIYLCISLSLVLNNGGHTSLD